MGSLRILVIGETCLDIFTYVSADRLAPDLPIPILQVKSQSENPGMAGNVARNLISLGAEVELVTNRNWKDVTKNRFMDERTNHAFVRIDHNDAIEPFTGQIDEELYDCIVISDYDKGFLTKAKIEELSNFNKPVFLDTKKPLGHFASGVSFLKLNEFEFDRSRDNFPQELLMKTIVTLGAKGALFQGKIYAAPVVEVGDASGAGDAFFAQFVVSIMTGLSTEDAIEKANISASGVVSERGVTLING